MTCPSKLMAKLKPIFPSWLAPLFNLKKIVLVNEKITFRGRKRIQDKFSYGNPAFFFSNIEQKGLREAQFKDRMRKDWDERIHSLDSFRTWEHQSFVEKLLEMKPCFVSFLKALHIQKNGNWNEKAAWSFLTLPFLLSVEFKWWVERNQDLSPLKEISSQVQTEL